ncbi:MAG TPA: PIN domain-containing protein [Bryobacteraceae bacterium]|nr:PIN domain-containing protein [Bryobacteraceae bacterium]
MTLVDTSVWVDHFRQFNSSLERLLVGGSVLIHPFVVGELACGNLKNRQVTLGHLNELPEAIPATHDEVFQLINDRKLWGQGIGWTDAHLLASAMLANCTFWTLEQRLAATARATGVKLFEDTAKPS